MGIGVGVFVPSPIFYGRRGLMSRYEAGVRSDGGSFAFPIDTGLASRLEGLGLLNASSLVNSCNAGKESVLYNLVPTPVQSLDRFAVTRSTVKWVLGANGVLTSIPANTPAFEYNTDGTYRCLLLEPAATNLALHSRDLTQAAWTATNATTSRTAVGADGTSNTGTIVTATAGNATILQAITSASSARVFSARVRRRTGTGAVEITQDNGLTWTAIALTSSYQLFSTPAQTLTNPTVGFRVVTSGDEIDVDFCQAETGSIVSSPIVTSGGTITRTTDSLTLAGASSLIGQSEGTIFMQWEYNASSGTSRSVLTLEQDANNRIIIGLTSAGSVQQVLTHGGVAIFNETQVQVPNVSANLALGYKTGDTAVYVGGTLVDSDAAAFSAFSTLSSITLSPALGVRLRSLVLFPTRLPNATLAILTQ